ncbi:MAG: hypothetical protein PUP91_10205 [Rhizonema sp. PD37]|nr:hypothetical protein [Rhizonema sp. PD37]
MTNFPNMGRSLDYLVPLSRGFSVGNYRIFISLIEKGVEVDRVMCGYCDLDTLFAEDDNS